jgi:chromosome partitioning protein
MPKVAKLARHLPLVITIAGSKGGIGKSTLAIALADCWHAVGHRVLLVDADDEQRTALTWAEVAGENERDVPQVIALGDNVHTEVSRQAPSFDIVIIDTPGRNGKRTQRAMRASRLALLPCGPSGPEIWAMDATLAQAADVAELEPNLEIAILVTRKQPGTVIGRRARVSLDEADVLVLDTELEYRVTYAEAITAGTGVTEYAPGSAAAAEITRLAAEIEARFGVRSRRTARRVRRA